MLSLQVASSLALLAVSAYPQSYASLSSTVVASAMPSGGSSKLCSAPVQVTAQQLKTIVPLLAMTAADCKATQWPDECATADEAAKGINAAFKTFAVNTVGLAAGSIANMAAESVNFNAKRNKSPGRPGQGTYDMGMPATLVQYASAVKLANLTAINPAWATCGGAQACDGTPDQQTSLLNSLLVPEHEFATSAWYMQEGFKVINPSACSANFHDDLTNGNVASFKACLISDAPMEDFFTRGYQTLACDTTGSGSSSGNSSVKSTSSMSSHQSASLSTAVANPVHTSKEDSKASDSSKPSVISGPSSTLSNSTSQTTSSKSGALPLGFSRALLFSSMLTMAIGLFYLVL